MGLLQCKLGIIDSGSGSHLVPILAPTPKLLLFWLRHRPLANFGSGSELTIILAPAPTFRQFWLRLRIYSYSGSGTNLSEILAPAPNSHFFWLRLRPFAISGSGFDHKVQFQLDTAPAPKPCDGLLQFKQEIVDSASGSDLLSILAPAPTKKVRF